MIQLEVNPQDRIDTAVGGISRLLKGLPEDSLLLVRELLDEALEDAHARSRPPQFSVIHGDRKPEGEAGI